jgi:hypothetical protein
MAIQLRARVQHRQIMGSIGGISNRAIVNRIRSTWSDEACVGVAQSTAYVLYVLPSADRIFDAHGMEPVNIAFPRLPSYLG